LRIQEYVYQEILIYNHNVQVKIVDDLYMMNDDTSNLMKVVSQWMEEFYVYEKLMIDRMLSVLANHLLYQLIEEFY
jgi:hypothetical protein